jgi:hypothetical protein
VRNHEGLVDAFPGQALTSRQQVEEWVHYTRWATAFDAGRAPADLAKFLAIPVRAQPPTPPPVPPAPLRRLGPAWPRQLAGSWRGAAGGAGHRLPG